MIPPIGNDTIEDALPRDESGRDELPCELRGPVEVPDVVGDPDETMSRVAPRIASICVGFWKMIATFENRENRSPRRTRLR